MSRAANRKMFADVTRQQASRVVARSRGDLGIDMDHHQAVLVNSRKYYSALVAGIGAGKSYAGCIRAIQAAYGNVGGHRIKTPNLGMITAPTFPMLRDATLRTFEEIAGDLLINYNKSEHLATMSNGSEILFRSTHDYETLRGPNLS
ncbi:hypothetical protein KAR91_40505, partial [Candidatus Pacearchaeota archaeon]|nr:hypothetical protein [Candidatus Pacearchaeota archaeon]